MSCHTSWPCHRCRGWGWTWRGHDPWSSGWSAWGPWGSWKERTHQTRSSRWHKACLKDLWWAPVTTEKCVGFKFEETNIQWTAHTPLHFTCWGCRLELGGISIFPVIPVFSDISLPKRAIFFSTEISLKPR